MNEFWEKISAFFVQIMPYLIPILLIVLIAVLVFTILLFLRYRKVDERAKMFFGGEKAETYEQALRRILEENKMLKAQDKELALAIKNINEKLETSYRKIGIVKYNAFANMAGKISSSICLLNDDNNGIILNCMHGPEGCYVYAKEIMNGKSVIALTEEDENALEKAMETDF